MHKKKDTTNIFQLAFYSQNDYFAQNWLNLDQFSLIVGKMNKHCAKFYTYGNDDAFYFLRYLYDI